MILDILKKKFLFKMTLELKSLKEFILPISRILRMKIKNLFYEKILTREKSYQQSVKYLSKYKILLRKTSTGFNLYKETKKGKKFLIYITQFYFGQRTFPTHSKPSYKPSAF